MTLAGKVAVVTGGSRGIGRAIAERLARDGAKVIVNFVHGEAAAESTVEAIRSNGGHASTIQCDVSDFTAVQACFKEIATVEGRIDILVNNAGITRDGLLARMTEEAWDAVLTTNLKGAFNCIKGVARTMMKQRWGRIINVSSVVGFAGNAGQVNYSAAKAGLSGLTKSTARELASRGVTVNGVAPGYIETDMTADLPDDIKEKLLTEIPMGSLGQPEDISGTVSFLASEESRYITGQFIHINGGMYM